MFSRYVEEVKPIKESLRRKRKKTGKCWRNQGQRVFQGGRVKVSRRWELRHALARGSHGDRENSSSTSGAEARCSDRGMNESACGYSSEGPCTCGYPSEGTDLEGRRKKQREETGWGRAFFFKLRRPELISSHTGEEQGRNLHLTFRNFSSY